MSYAVAVSAIFAIASLAIGIWLVTFLARLREDLEASVVWMRNTALRLDESMDRFDAATTGQSNST